MVYCKAPFGGPELVLKYLARNTHRVAIANSRILSLEKGRIRFSWKDYRAGGARKIAELDAEHFLQRFLLHVLPPWFVRIRDYGFLANRNKAEALAQARASLGASASSPTHVEEEPSEGPAEESASSEIRCQECGGELLVHKLHPRRRWTMRLLLPVAGIDSS